MREEERHKALVESHDQESRDRAWATETERSIEDGLAARAARAPVVWSVAGVDCRSSTCRVDVVWPTYVDAASTFSELLRADYGVACGTEITLPDPQDKTLEYHESLILTCREPE